MTPTEFRTARQALGLTVPEMAEALGIHRRTVYKYETGERDIPRTIELLIAKLLE